MTRICQPGAIAGRTDYHLSDVYSLGVLLYELLTGERPYRLGGTTLSETVRLVCGRRPTTAERYAAGTAGRPGRREHESHAQGGRTAGSTFREEFSTDIGRYLSNWPVLARRGSFRYVVRKFVARHKVAMSV